MPNSKTLRRVIFHSASDTSRFTLVHLRVLFARSTQTLLLIARKVLDDDEKANEAVANCLARACQHFRMFADEAELRRWLVRLAIDEALLLVCREETATLPALALENESHQ